MPKQRATRAPNADALADDLVTYMDFRAACEGTAHQLDQDFYTAYILMGVSSFFGITWNKQGRLCRDVQNPMAFALWTGNEQTFN
jgi:hypothetical protein